jgi:uncharacterized lipoprotein
MKKITLLSFILISVFFLSACSKNNDENVLIDNNQKESEEVKKATRVEDATYIIDGVSYQLNNGEVEISEVPDSASKTKVKIFSSDKISDINKDGEDDYVVILTQDPGGSGTFYFVSLALSSDNGFSGTNSILLGDRIAPQNVNTKEGQIVVNYAIRYPGDSFDVKPSFGVSKYFFLADNELKEDIKE